jgi:predicted DNA-binding protein (MmcQ/YjbR family)
LSKKYPDTVELNCRGNFTKTGLPLADTHYVTANGQKVCFAYVYETAGAMMLILKTKDALGKELAKNPSVSKSAFPKAKDSWYSVIVDDSLTNAQVEKMLDDTIALYTND